jgi:hypothetical protein
MRSNYLSRINKLESRAIGQENHGLQICAEILSLQKDPSELDRLRDLCMAEDCDMSLATCAKMSNKSEDQV